MFAHLGHVLGGCSQLIGGGFLLPPALSRVTKPCCVFVEGHGAWSEQHLLPPLGETVLAANILNTF